MDAWLRGSCPKLKQSPRSLAFAEDFLTLLFILSQVKAKMALGMSQKSFDALKADPAKSKAGLASGISTELGVAQEDVPDAGHNSAVSHVLRQSRYSSRHFTEARILLMYSFKLVTLTSGRSPSQVVARDVLWVLVAVLQGPRASAAQVTILTTAPSLYNERPKTPENTLGTELLHTEL